MCNKRVLRLIAFVFAPARIINAVPVLTVGGSPGSLGQTALELWANWVNANSQTAGHTVTLDFSDYDVNTYQAVVTDNMANWDIVIPPYGSSQSDTVVTLVDGAKPILVWGGASEFIFEHEGAQGAKVFGTFTPASRYFDSGLQAASDAGATTAVFVANDSPFSSACCTGAQAKAAELGMTDAGSFEYNRNDDDATLATLAGSVAATEADVVVNCGHEADTVRIVMQLGAAEFCPKAMIATNSLLNVDTHYTGDSASLPQGIMMPTQWSSLAPNVDDPVTGWTEAEFLSAYVALSVDSVEPTYHATSAFLAGLSITSAMQSLDGDMFVEADFLTAMRALDVQTVVGRVKFSGVTPVGANTMKPMMTEQMHEAIQIVAPCQSKSRDPEYPRQCAGGSASSGVLAPCNDGEDGEDGTPDNGTPDNGTADDGTLDNGTPDDGTPDDGTPDDGTTSSSCMLVAPTLFLSVYCTVQFCQ